MCGPLHPPLEGEGRRACNARRGGVKVSPRERCPVWRLSPHPVEHLTMLADPPPSGEGEATTLPRCQIPASNFFSVACRSASIAAASPPAFFTASAQLSRSGFAAFFHSPSCSAVSG